MTCSCIIATCTIAYFSFGLQSLSILFLSQILKLTSAHPWTCQGQLIHCCNLSSPDFMTEEQENGENFSGRTAPSAILPNLRGPLR